MRSRILWTRPFAVVDALAARSNVERQLFPMEQVLTFQTWPLRGMGAVAAVGLDPNYRWLME